MTLSPVCFSISILAFFAAVPPALAIFLLFSNPRGFFFFDISVTDASASIFNTNSRLVILSLKFSFFNPLYLLYSLTLRSAHAMVISSVSIAYSSPSFISRSFHSSVSSFRTSMLFNRWFIHSFEYPFCKYVFIARSKASSGSSVSSILSYPTRASHNLKGSAFGEGIDWTTRSKSSVEKQSVAYFFPSEAINFSCTIFSYTSLPSFFNLCFKSLQYRFGTVESAKIPITSITEKYHDSFSSSYRRRTSC